MEYSLCALALIYCAVCKVLTRFCTKIIGAQIADSHNNNNVLTQCFARFRERKKRVFFFVIVGLMTFDFSFCMFVSPSVIKTSVRSAILYNVEINYQLSQLLFVQPKKDVHRNNIKQNF